jgi:hypothetical protein
VFDSSLQVAKELSTDPAEGVRKLSKGSRAPLSEGVFGFALTSAGQLLDGADELVVGTLLHG